MHGHTNVKWKFLLDLYLHQQEIVTVTDQNFTKLTLHVNFYEVPIYRVVDNPTNCLRTALFWVIMQRVMAIP